MYKACCGSASTQRAHRQLGLLQCKYCRKDLCRRQPLPGGGGLQVRYSLLCGAGWLAACWPACLFTHRVSCIPPICLALCKCHHLLG